MTERKFISLHNDLKKACETYKSCTQKIEVNKGIAHAVKRGQEEDEATRILREMIGRREIAAIILQGSLRLDQCRDKGSHIEVAIEGVLKHWETFDFKNDLGVCFPEVHIRVVARDTGSRMYLIVTFYPLWEENKEDGTPEVNCDEIWK